MSNTSIWPRNRSLSGATTPGQIRPASDVNEGVLRIPQSSSECLVSYTVQSLVVVMRYPPNLQRCIRCFQQSKPIGQISFWAFEKKKRGRTSFETLTEDEAELWYGITWDKTKALLMYSHLEDCCVESTLYFERVSKFRPRSRSKISNSKLIL